MSDDFLEGLRGAGRPDSEGRFTVDHLRASELLRRHRLIEPERWVLKAVQAAVALGAARVDVTVDAARVQVWHDAPPLSRKELETALSAALPAAADRRGTGLRHLAVALDGALARGALRVTLESPDFTMALTPDGQVALTRLTVREEPAPPALTVHLPGRPSLWRLGKAPPELRLVREGCLYAAIPIVANGAAVNRPYFGLEQASRFRGADVLELGPLPRAGHLGEMYLTSPDAGTDLLPGPALGGVERERRLHVAALAAGEGVDLGPPARFPGLRPDGRPAVACHALMARTRQSWSAATFVLDGVILESERNLMDRPGLLAILAARGLRTDLTEFALVHDDAFHRAIDYLRRVALWMYD